MDIGDLMMKKQGLRKAAQQPAKKETWWTRGENTWSENETGLKRNKGEAETDRNFQEKAGGFPPKKSRGVQVQKNRSRKATKTPKNALKKMDRVRRRTAKKQRRFKSTERRRCEIRTIGNGPHVRRGRGAGTKSK